MLSLRDVTVRFGEFAAVEHVSLELAPGRVLAVLGPSGCGKSTMLRAIAGLEELSAGAVSFDGADMARVPTHRRGFALLFQDGQLFTHQSVGANVAYPLRLRSVPRLQRRRRVAELLELVGLSEAEARRTSELSGGEQQRVALARALAAAPRLLLLDEPLSALDTELRERLAGDVRAILAETGTTTLVVTHDHDEACATSDDLAVMMGGRVVQHGPTDEVWRGPATPEVARFLGYTTIVQADAAGLVARAAGLPKPGPGDAWALRRSALRVAERAGAGSAPGAGPSSSRRPWLEGQVCTVVPRSDDVAVEVAVEGVGIVSAVGPRSAPPQVGEAVRLRVDRAGLAPLAASRRAGS